MLDKLNKYLVYAIYALVITTAVNTCSTCSTSKDLAKTRRSVDTLSSQINDLRGQIYTKEQSDIRFAAEGYEISKRMLYDQNAIVRTVMRPDDRMAEYDKKIKELREKLK